VVHSSKKLNNSSGFSAYVRKYALLLTNCQGGEKVFLLPVKAVVIHISRLFVKSVMVWNLAD
jgi:hypothetical protein